jgi:hypothetical protein
MIDFFTPFPTFPHRGRRDLPFPPWGKQERGSYPNKVDFMIACKTPKI